MHGDRLYRSEVWPLVWLRVSGQVATSSQEPQEKYRGTHVFDAVRQCAAWVNRKDRDPVIL